MTNRAEKLKACANTDRELWRETEGDYYAPSIHVTEHGGIGIDIGGTVVVRPIREWHALTTRTPAPSSDIEELVERLDRKIASTGAWMTSDLREFYTELRDTLLAIQGERDAAVEGFALADRLVCAAIEGGFYVGEGLLAELASTRAALTPLKAYVSG